MDNKIFLKELAKLDVEVRNPFGKELDAYYYNDVLFAIWYVDKRPARVSLRCDYKLSRDIRERYESVLRGQNLDHRKWNTLIITEQLGEQFVLDMIRHAQEIAKQEAREEVDN